MPLSNVGLFKSFASICEAYIYRLVCLDVYDTVDVIGIGQLKRLCRSVVCTLDVYSFAVSFAFDEIA